MGGLSGGRLEGGVFSLPFEVGMGGEGGGSAWANFVGCLLRVVRHQKSGRGWMDDGWTDACEVKPGRSASSDAENPSWGVAGTRRQGGPKRFVSIVGRFLFPLPQAVLFLSWWSRSRRPVPCGWLAGWLVLSVCRSRQFPPHIMSIQGMWVSIHDVPRPSILILVMVQPHPSPSAA